MRYLRGGLCIIAFVITLLAPGVLHGAPIDSDSETFEILAEKTGSAGAELDSGFIIRHGAEIDKDTIADMLKILPEVEYTLSQQSQTETLISITGGLTPRTVYIIRLGTGESAVSRAFQTKDVFKVVQTMPASDRAHVEVTSGIELYFSQPVSLDKLSGHISISPSLSGRYEQIDSRTVVFIPEEGMQYSTEYTVELDKNLMSESGDTLTEGYTFGFSTQYDYNASVSTYDFNYYDYFSETFLCGDPIVMKLRSSDKYANLDTSVRLYRYNSADEYVNALLLHEKDYAYADVEGLELVGEFTQKLMMDTNLFWHVGYVEMPENPGEGYYIADMYLQTDAGELRAQKMIQVTDISVYSQTINGQVLFWVNDAATGEPLRNAAVSVAGQKTRTDKNGIALIDIDLDLVDRYEVSERVPVSIVHKDRVFNELIYLYDAERNAPDDMYYSYVYTDREAYQPTDTVRYWGVIAPRNKSVSLPKTLTLDWTDGGKYPNGMEVRVNKDGTFSGEISLEKHASGGEGLHFLADGESLLYKYISILEYTKPVYTTELSFDKPYYRLNDTVVLTVNITFFDGTPAPGIEVSIHDTVYRSDASGVVSAEFPAASQYYRDDPMRWEYTYETVSVDIGGVEDLRIWDYGTYLLFPRDYTPKAGIKSGGGKDTLILDVYEIDYESVENGAFAETGDTADLYGERADVTGSAALTEVTYTKHKMGEYYDFITKKVVERFSYERVETVVWREEIQTKNGHITMPLPTEKDRSYYLTLDLLDADGLTHLRSLYDNIYSQYNDSDPLFTAYYFETPDKNSIYDEAEIAVIDNRKNTPEGGRTLYTVFSDKHMLYDVTEDSSFTLEFLPEYAPNVRILGAYFDGRHIYAVSSPDFWDSAYYTSWRYDSEDSRLNIAVTPDSWRYTPGGEAEISIEITDKDGKGVPASFIISVADEAAFAVAEQYVNPIGSLYPWQYYRYSQYTSYVEPYDVYGGAESGDGGSDAVRREFVDTAAFIMGTSDKDGKAEAGFKLPDNITSWRITGVAFSNRYYGEINIPYAGNSQDNVQAGLPFFLNHIVNKVYVSGDSIGVNMRTAGNGITADDVILYTVSLKGEGVDDTLTARGRAGQYTTVSFDPLPPGEYTVLTTARLKDYSDAVETRIQVVGSALTTNRSHSGNLADGIDIKSERYPVEIMLYDLDNALYYDILYRMLGSYGERADQQIARAIAGRILNAIHEQAYYPEDIDAVADELRRWSSYGVRVLPVTEEDVLLTAKAVTAAPEFFNAADLAGYFTSVLEDSDWITVDSSAALMGLAALGEPVLIDLYEQFAVANELGSAVMEPAVYLATGIALLGDTYTALDWYNNVLSEYITGNDKELSFSNGTDLLYNYRITAGAAVLACVTGHEDHSALLRYLYNTKSRLYLPIMELAVYAGRFSPRPESPSAFNYMLNGKPQTHSFKKKPFARLELGETQLESAEFSVTQGDVGYNIRYFGGIDGEPGFPDGVALDTKISANNARIGDIVMVTTTITFDKSEAVAGSYHIRQIVPSGLRFVRAGLIQYDGIDFGMSSRYSSYYTHDFHRIPFHFYEGENNTINFYISPLRGSAMRTMPKSVTFMYEARAILPGEYVVEATALSIVGQDNFYHSERDLMTIE